MFLDAKGTLSVLLAVTVNIALAGNNDGVGGSERGNDRLGNLDRQAWSRDRGDRRVDDSRRNSFNRDGDRSGRGNFGGRGFDGHGFGGFHGGGRGRR